jgi:hypothetical protein
MRLKLRITSSGTGWELTLGLDLECNWNQTWGPVPKLIQELELHRNVYRSLVSVLILGLLDI